MPRKRSRTIRVSAVALLVGAAAATLWPHMTSYVSTSAMVNAPVLRIKAPFDGTVTQVSTGRTGEPVSRGDALLSLERARLLLDFADSADAGVPGRGDRIAPEVAGVGAVPALVRRSWPSAEVPGTELGVEFDLPVSARRDALIAKLFTEGRDNFTHARDAWSVSWQMMRRIIRADREVAATAAPRSPTPDWLVAEMGGEAQIPRAG